MTGMTSAEIGAYFATLETDLASANNAAEALVHYDVDMSFRPVTLTSNERVADDICILTFDRPIDIQAGEFVFLWIPGLGEKPFSALTDDPFSLVIISQGQFTEALLDLQPGTQCYVRGPHGQPAELPAGKKLVAVAGGTGLAAVYQLVRDFVRDGGAADIFVGARTASRLYFADECAACAELHIATDDGSRGFHGLVTEALESHLQALPAAELENLLFYNCGPAAMVHAAVAVQRKFCAPEQIFTAIDYLTKCGVGICGACAAPDGRRLCVDGPFLRAT